MTNNDVELRQLRAHFRELYSAGGETTMNGWATLALDARTGIVCV